MNPWTNRAVGVLAALALAGAVGCENEASAQQGQPGQQPAQQNQPRSQAQGQPIQQRQAQQYGQQQQPRQFQQPQQFGQQQRYGQQRPFQATGGGPASAATIRQFTQWADTVENVQLVNHTTASTGLNLLWAAADAVSDQTRVNPQAAYGYPQGGGPAPQYGFSQRTAPVSPQGYSALGTIRQQQRQLRMIALELEDTESVAQHPFLMRSAAQSTVNLFDAMSQVGSPEASDQIEQVREISQQIDVNTPLVAQGSQVRDFFKASAQVIDQMAQNTEQGAVGGGPQQGQQKQGQQNQDQQKQGQQKNQQN